MRHSRALLAVVVAIGVLALGVATVSANRLSYSNRGIRIVWSAFRFGTTSTCAVTLEGTLQASTFQKFGGSEIGSITRAIIGHPCTGSEVHFLTTAEGQAVESLPWTIRYNAFSGSLPQIEEVLWTIHNASWRVQELLECLFEATGATNPWVVELRLGLRTGRVETVRMREEFRILGNCRVEVAVSGSGTMTVLSSTTSITVRLI